MKVIKFLKNKTIYSFIAALLVSVYIYFVIRAGQLFPVPFSLKSCAGAGSSACSAPDSTSLTALYVNIIFIWFVFFFFYLCFSIYEVLSHPSGEQEKNVASQTQ